MNRNIVPSALALVNQLVEQRFQALNQLQPGQSVLNVTVREGNKKFLCIYKRHDRATITVESTKGTLDWMFRGKDLVLSQIDFTPEEMTFNLRDIQISDG